MSIDGLEKFTRLMKREAIKVFRFEQFDYVVKILSLDFISKRRKINSFVIIEIDFRGIN